VAVDDDRETGGFFHAVRRAALDLAVGSLLVARADSVVVISDADGDWNRMRHEIDRVLGGLRCRIGVGGRCTRPSDFPRSYREARLALKVQSAAGSGTQSTEFDALGVIRILAESEEFSGIERFVDLWLGALREYDEAHGTALVETLSHYLEQGGNYEATAHVLSTHRNTVKYRLQRIRAISGLDLADPDTRFNLQLATRALQTMNALSS
jgi:DNA-binding PucR family transcriptional regulator